MNQQQFPWKKTFLVGFGFLGLSMIWPIFNQFIPLFLQAGNPEFERQLLAEGRQIPNIVGFGLAPGLALFIMTWDNLLNMFIAPWAGAKSDQTWNRFGRRKGWILLGAPIALLAFVFIPVAQTVLAMAVFILITDLGMAVFRSPIVSWLGDLFEKESRSKANGILNLMAGVGGLLAYFGGGLLFKSLGRSAPFISGAIVTAIALLTVFLFVKEPRELRNSDSGEQAEKGAGIFDNLRILFANPDKSGILVLVSILLWFMAYSALDTGLSSFAVFTLGIEPGNAAIYSGLVTISFIVFAVPAGILGTRIGRGRTIQIGLIGLTLTILVGFFIIRDTATFISVIVPIGGFWALVNVNSLPLVYDHGDERRIGAYTGLYYFFSQLAAVLGPTLGGLVVGAFGNQYRWLWLFSFIFMALAVLTMQGVKRGQVQTVA